MLSYPDRPSQMSNDEKWSTHICYCLWYASLRRERFGDFWATDNQRKRATNTISDPTNVCLWSFLALAAFRVISPARRLSFTRLQTKLQSDHDCVPEYLQPSNEPGLKDTFYLVQFTDKRSKSCYTNLDK